MRELRQNLSVFLRRVEQGESLEVTARGRAVALLAPLPERATLRERLITDGSLLPAKRDLAELTAPPPASLVMPISQALEEEREERDLR